MTRPVAVYARRGSPVYVYVYVYVYGCRPSRIQQSNFSQITYVYVLSLMFFALSELSVSRFCRLETAPGARHVHVTPRSSQFLSSSLE